MNRTTILLMLIVLNILSLSAGEGVYDEISQSPKIPVSAVALYTAGLAWIEHETTITDNEIIYFSVDQKDINDILKSLVVEDLGGGYVDSINFDSEDPLSHTLSDLRVNPSGSPSILDFIRRTQGEQVSVKTPDGEFSGRIFSVESYEREEGRDTILNLMDFSGIISINISNLIALQFLDRELQEELLKALDLIARSRVKSSRMLKLSFKGKGVRKIKLSYVRAVPLWKTSYRIILDKEGRASLEAWALVQNTGILDWDNIRLSFIAGSPNAFTMDLATPKYVIRQEIAPSSATPLGSIEYKDAYAPPLMSRSDSNKSSGMYRSEMVEESLMYDDYEEPLGNSSLVSQARGERTGNYYKYEIEQPVTVGGRSSAMIPIISQENVGTSLALYDPQMDLVFKGINLKNNSDAHWATGPVSVKEGSYYSGDAIIPHMIPDTDRLITYSIHGSVKVIKESEQNPQKIESLKIVDGILHRQDKMVRTTEYHISGDEKELILIHPKEYGWSFVDDPKIEEENPSQYRFLLKDWDKPFVLKEEYIISQEYSLFNISISDINYYLQWNDITNSMKNAFKEMASIFQKIDDYRNKISTSRNRVSRLESDQNRVRENMKVLDKNSQLYIQYSQQLSSQEDEIQSLYKEINLNEDNLDKSTKDLQEYIRNLQV